MRVRVKEKKRVFFTLTPRTRIQQIQLIKGFEMPRPRLGDLKVLTKYQQAEKDYRTAMEQHFEALAAACFRWRAEHEHDDFLLADSNQGLAGTKGEAKC